MALRENVFAVAFNACRVVFFKTPANVLYRKGFDKKQSIKNGIDSLVF